MVAFTHRRRPAIAGLLLGVGLGGFADGIVLHQILAWHNMLSSVLPPVTLDAMHVNMRWDGYFHAGSWLATLTGVLLLWPTVRQPVQLPGTSWLVGLMLTGWGTFNLVEGVIDHQLLQIHHVRGYGPNLVWDMGFLASGVVLIAIGLTIARAASAPARPNRR